MPTSLLAVPAPAPPPAAVARPSRDRAEFTAFVTARSGRLQRAAYLVVGDVQHAQDLVQEALTKTYVAWPRLTDVEHAEAYTRKAITTTAITWFRRRPWHERTVEHHPDGVVRDPSDDVVEHTAVWTAVRRLPVRQRTALVLRYYEDLTEAQTAEAMGCSVGAIKSQVAAARATLRDVLGDVLGDPLGDRHETAVTGASR